VEPMKIVTIRAVFLLFFALGQQLSSAEIPADVASARQKQFEATVLRFFAGITSYQEGDLIVRSDVAELQDYLRKTHHHSAATHPALLKRVLPDHSQLARLFYTSQGGQVLRIAAKKLGGYADLDRFTRTAIGRGQLREAISSSNADILVEMLAKKSIEQQIEQATDVHSKNAPPRNQRIYTVKQFLRAVQSQ